MRTKYLFFTLLLVFCYTSISIAQITEKPGYGKYAIVGATLHTVTHGTIPNGVILINEDKIESVGADVTVPSGYIRINAQGKHVYPGFMDSGTFLGLREISAVPVTIDNAELGNYNPHVKAFTAINPNSVNIPIARVSGITHVVSFPSSGRIAGMATLIDLYGYTPDAMAVQEKAGLHLQWPSALKRGWWDTRTDKKIRQDYEKNLNDLNEFWKQAISYEKMMELYEKGNKKNSKKPETNVRMEAMRDVIKGKIPVVISVERQKNIQNAMAWIKEHQGPKYIFAGVAEGWREAESIAKMNIPCLVSTLYTPYREYDNYQRPYQNPGMLLKAGVKVAIATGETENVRNATFHAGYATTYGKENGLTHEEAVKLLTLYPAQIFGVDDILGSLDEGKQANLFISSGDPFEPATQIEQVFIKGYKIPMVDRQSQLYKEFLNRDKTNSN